MSAGALVATMILVWRILTPFYSMCTMIPRLEQLRNSIIQVNDLMDIETEAKEAQSHSRLPMIKGHVAFNNVSFKYNENADAVFESLSFEAMPGDTVAITGGNGCGKATILKLIKSLHKPMHGTIRIDGFDIRQLDAPHIRRQIAYVPKHPSFYNGSIVENMRFSNPLATKDDIIKALELADAMHDVERFPDGLNTIIGSYGEHRITSSLAARLSLARAYLHSGSLLLIDELPNTLLSSQTGKNLKNYILQAKGKRTILFCTYRQDFLEMADTIVCLRGLDKPIVGSADIVYEQIKSAEVA
jgi:ABC-type bacteriocin/lantibiotic exporter with double-glycine peptidase domain